MPDSAPQTIRLDDYRVPDFLVDTVDLTFDLFEDGATVTSKLAIRRNPQSDGAGAALVLDGQHLELVSAALNGEELGGNRYTIDADSLTLPDMPDDFTLDIVTRIEPHKNSPIVCERPIMPSSWTTIRTLSIRWCAPFSHHQLKYHW